MDLANEWHPAHVLQFPLELSVQVCSPVVQIAVRVVVEPAFPARDEESHASLDVERTVVEGYAQPADVGVSRREEPLAQIRQGAVGAHEVEGVSSEVVVHCFVVELFAYQEQLRLGVGWRARWASSTCSSH